MSFSVTEDHVIVMIGKAVNSLCLWTTLTFSVMTIHVMNDDGHWAMLWTTLHLVFQCENYMYVMM